MDSGLLALSYEEIKARYDVIAEMIHDSDPLKDVTYTHCICNPMVPLLSDLGLALDILRKARERQTE